jgi:Flp pilus assembly protein TadD
MSKPRGKKPQAKAKSEQAVAPVLQDALDATLAGKAEAAVDTLLALLQREPANATARHLLGAQYAKAGRTEEAAMEMAMALELNPGLHLARFQLGLLLCTNGVVDKAAAIWAPLDALGEEHVLQRFKTGMLLMMRERYDDARSALQEARTANLDLPALNGEIDVALQAIAEATGAAQGAALPEAPQVKPPEAKEETKTEEPAEEETGDNEHILVSTYSQSRTLH